MKQIKVSDEVHERLKEIAEKRGVSISDLIEEMLNLYLGGSSERAVVEIKRKEIVVDNEKFCNKCRRKINSGELAVWVLYKYSDNSFKTAYYCLECAFPYLSKLYRKQRELELVTKQLRAEANELAEKVNELEKKYNILQIKKEVVEFWKTFANSFLNEPDFNKKFNEFMDKLIELLDKVTKIENSLEVRPLSSRSGERMSVRNFVRG